MLSKYLLLAAIAWSCGIVACVGEELSITHLVTLYIGLLYRICLVSCS